MIKPEIRLRSVTGLILIALIAAAGPVVAQKVSVPAPLAASSLLLDVERAGDRLVAVGERGHVLLSDDSGATWRQIVVPTRATLTAVTFADGTNGWAVGHDAVVLHTGDGGENWMLQYADPALESPLMDVRFADPQTGFAVGAYGLFLETLDGGTHWAQRWVNESDFHFNAVLNPAPGRWFMAGEFGGLYRSSDDGQDWQALDSPYKGSFFGALPLGRDDLLVFGLQGNMFRSGDGGKNWVPIPTGTSAALVGGTVLASGSILVVGLSGVMLASNDGGRIMRLTHRADRSALTGIVEAPDGSLVLVGEAGAVRVAPDRLATLGEAEPAQ